MIVVNFSGEKILSNSSKRKKGVLANFIPFPYYLNHVLHLLVGDYLKKRILIDYVEHTSSLPVLVNQHVVYFSFIRYVIEKS